MGFRSFRVQIIIRIVLLLGGLTLLAWSLVRGEYLKSVYLGLLVILLLFEFFHHADKVNRDISQFMLSIFHDDFTFIFDAGSKGRSYRKLYDSMNDITLRFRALGREKETGGLYLNSLIEQVRVGIISYEPGGKVHLVNRAFREMMDAQAIQPGCELNLLKPEIFSLLNNASLDQRKLIPLKIRNEEKEFSIQTSGFRMEERNFVLVSVQDIRAELDEREFEAWRKLIRVLTHEIMNSVTPIASLSGSLYDLIEDDAGGYRRSHVRERIMTGLAAIRERSTGLLKFTEAYQRLARLPQPEPRNIRTADFIARLDLLFRGDLEEMGIKFTMDSVNAPQMIRADPEQIEQVIINLVRNGEEALSGVDDPAIHLEVNEHKGYSFCIQIRDNGTGIEEENLDRIFIPFFTTKKEGTGVGLSISRQIILMHKGILNVKSRVGEGSVFEILI